MWWQWQQVGGVAEGILLCAVERLAVSQVLPLSTTNTLHTLLLSDKEVCRHCQPKRHGPRKTTETQCSEDPTDEKPELGSQPLPGQMQFSLGTC